jgi:hypothetical protein
LRRRRREIKLIGRGKEMVASRRRGVGVSYYKEGVEGEEVVHAIDRFEVLHASSLDCGRVEMETLHIERSYDWHTRRYGKFVCFIACILAFAYLIVSSGGASVVMVVYSL